MNRRVLLVDDCADFQDGVRLLLHPRCDVHVAASGHEALEVCERRGPFAVVVSDYCMPGMSGVELLSTLHERWPHTVRIMLTGCSELELALEALDEGAIFRFLTKPPEATRLIGSVEAGLERYRIVEEERLLTEQLLFARESLLALTETLERRLEHELGRMDALERFAQELRATSSLEEIAAASLAALERLFGGRAARIVLGDPHSAATISAGAPALEADQAHREPLRSGERELGFIQLALAGSGLSGRERRVLSIVASSAGLAAESAIRGRQTEAAQQATIFALARLAENRDDDTGAHLERVSEYCRFLARGLREDGRCTAEITDAFVADIGLAAPLHDIGKVAIPDSILFKPGKLDEQEWVIMRTHAAVGAETLRGVLEGAGGEQGFLRMAHEIAWCHHERWDGAGYPRGLSGETIPLAARIMSLADCYDALTNVRPYKHAWPHAEAVAYVQEQRGRAFDPDVVDAFSSRAEAFEAIRARLADAPRAAA